MQQIIVKVAKYAKFNTKNKVNNVEKKLPVATFLINLNQYNTDR